MGRPKRFGIQSEIIEEGLKAEVLILVGVEKFSEFLLIQLLQVDLVLYDRAEGTLLHTVGVVLWIIHCLLGEVVEVALLVLQLLEERFHLLVAEKVLRFEVTQNQLSLTILVKLV